MKTKLYIISILLFLVVNANGQIKITSNHVTTIGNTAAEMLTVDYTGYCGGGLAIYPSYPSADAFLGKSNHQFLDIYSCNYVTVSDARIKENIRSINNALSIIKQLNGVEYDYKMSFFANDTSKMSSKKINAINKSRKNYLGFLAQDVQKVLPEVVTYDDSTDLYAIDYTKVVPVLAEAIKTLAAQVDSQKIQINALKGKNSSLKSAEITTSVESTDVKVTDVATLSQNAPNPFSVATTINYYLPETVRQATINIYDLTGFQIKSIPVALKGNGSITINGYELRPGIFIYNLITDGQEVASKRMVLTQ